MNSTQRIAIAIVLVGVLSAALITTLVVLYYEPGREQHAIVQQPDTALRLVMEPSAVQGYISGLAPGITRFVPGVPKVTSLQPRAFRTDWIHALPYELALLFREPRDGEIPTTFFVNPIPESSFLGEFNRFNALREIRGVTWTGSSAQDITPEYATASGAVAYNARWDANRSSASVAALGLPEIEGDHWLELSAVNAGNILPHLHAAMDRAWGQPGTQESSESLTLALPGVRRLHLTGDLSDDDELTFRITLNIADPQARDAVDRAMVAVSDALSDIFSRRWNWRFGGGYAWQGPTTLEGEYTLRGFEDRLRRALGGGR